MSKATIIVEGIVANDLEARDAGSHRVVEVSIPHTPRKRDGNDWVDAGPTTWFEATFWNEHADQVLRTLRKGDVVTITGTPDLEVYAKRDGTPGGKVRIQFPTIALVVQRPRQGQGGSGRGQGAVQGDGWATTPPGQSSGVYEAPSGWSGGDDSTPF